MRVLFATYSDKTHFLPMVPLAWALRAAGHEVRVATQPALVDVVAGTGLPVESVGRDHRLWRMLAARPEQLAAAQAGPSPPYDAAEWPEHEVSWEYLRDGYAKAVPWWHRMINEPMLDDLVELARSWAPDLVVWETNTFAGSIAATVCGAVHARLMWSLDYFGRTREMFLRRKPSTEAADPLAEWLDARVARYGMRFTEEMTTGHLTIDHLPASLRMPNDLPLLGMRYVDYNGAAAVPSWLWEPPRRPRVALTLGVSAVRQFGGYAVPVQELLDALGELDAEIVATLPDAERDKLDRVPDNASVHAFVPLHALVPTCAAVVHHAGPGTLCTTALHGVPHLALPKQYDEPYLAGRLEERGAGLSVPADGATGPRVAAAVRRLLDEPSFADGARDLRAEMQAMPSPAEVVSTLENYVARRQYTPSSSIL